MDIEFVRYEAFVEAARIVKAQSTSLEKRFQLEREAIAREQQFNSRGKSCTVECLQ